MASAGSSSMDSFEAELNPCSLETIPEPMRLRRRDNTTQQVWPLVLCCYQLDETIGYRRGQLQLFHITVPDVTSNQPSLPLHFGLPDEILKPSITSGILDGKWSAVTAGGGRRRRRRRRLFATAHASGEIKLHQLQKMTVLDIDDDDNNVNTTTTAALRDEADECFTLDFVAQSNLPTEERGIPPLCLSLNFASKVLHNNTTPSIDPGALPPPLPIVSTYSNGKVAIHDAVFLESGGISLVQRDAWHAHNMFTNPAEVWSADFCNHDAHVVVVSCGDEGKVKLWDVRATTRPMHVLSPFDAGATCASTHPRHEYLVACGSYDETLCLLDTRYLSTKQPVSRSKELGGGIWRIKWHPYKEERMLVAAMHGGCRVVEVGNWDSLEDEDEPSYDNLNDYEAQFSFQVTKEFCEHESMAYGADWLVCQHPTRNGFFEAAASCSFYDRAVFLWDSCAD